MKRAVVLGGGGSRGAYQVGVWRALEEVGYQYDIVCGTSVGSLNAALMAQGESGVAIELWSKITTSDVLNIQNTSDPSTFSGQRQLLREFVDRFVKEGGVDPAPLEEMLRQVIDEDAIRRSPVEFGLVTVEYPSMKPLVITKGNIPQGQLCDYLMASSACYPAMKSRHIADKRYIDGGYYSNLPIEIALEQGADEIIAVDLEAIGVVRRVRADKSIIKIRSRWDLGLFLRFDPVVAVRNIALGYNDTMKMFGRLEGEWYAFILGQSEANRARVRGALRGLTRRVNAAVHSGRNSFLDTLARDALRKVIGGRPGRTTAQTIRGWAEAAGRVLEIDPTPIYTFEQFNAALVEADGKRKEPSELFKKKLADLRDVAALGKALGQIDRPLIMGYIRSVLENPDGVKNAEERLVLFATLFPEEFMGALYLCTLEPLKEEIK